MNNSKTKQDGSRVSKTKSKQKSTGAVNTVRGQQKKTGTVKDSAVSAEKGSLCMHFSVPCSRVQLFTHGRGGYAQLILFPALAPSSQL